MPREGLRNATCKGNLAPGIPGISLAWLWCKPRCSHLRVLVTDSSSPPLPLITNIITTSLPCASSWHFSATVTGGIPPGRGQSAAFFQPLTQGQTSKALGMSSPTLPKKSGECGMKRTFLSVCFCSRCWAHCLGNEFFFSS